MIAILCWHVAVAAACAVGGRRLGRNVFVLAALGPAAAVAWLVGVTPGVLDGSARQQTVSWIPELGVGIDLRLDAFSLLIAWLVAGIGVLILLYSRDYFGDRPDAGRISSTLVLFAAAMLGIVTADNLLVLYVFWELTTVTSYALVGTDDRNGGARAAALQALLVTGSGGLAMLAGLVLLGHEAGTYQLSAILADPPDGTAFGVAAALILLGALTKSAQVPFSFWLPGAMAAPTPISAYLHSATMVKAGVYLVARFAPIFVALGWWRPTLVGIGLATMLVGGWRALRQHDLKLLLAHGTVSQLGFLMLLFGSGRRELMFAGCAMLLAHALFKAALFLVVGIVDHAAHSRDLRRLSGLGRRLPVVAAVALVAGGSMAGLPPVLGFVSKEAALEGLLHDGTWWAVAGVLVGSTITTAYTVRLLWGAFADKQPAELDRPVDLRDLHRPGAVLLGPALLLALLTVAAGLVAPAADALVVPATKAVTGTYVEEHLLLWHGFTPALGLSALAIGGGLVLFWQRRAVTAAQDRIGDPRVGERGYQLWLRSLNVTADRVTGTVQNGSLPIYLGVILLTAVVLPLPSLLRAWQLPELVVADSPLQVVVGGLLLAAAASLALARRRFIAVLMLGAIGFGVAVLFIIQGAPDLALTQLLIETLTLVLFVIVLRHLPDRFDPVDRPVWWPGRAMRIALAGAAGLFMATFALAASAARTAPSVSGEFLARSLPEADGKNVVNVILVDFRGFDTMGEITVLAVAALGIASLVLAGRLGRPSVAPSGEAVDAGLAAAEHQAEHVLSAQRLATELVAEPDRPRRSVIIETGARSIVPTGLVFSLYLLFAGHNQPGGGFVGGLVAGAVLVLRWLTDGRPERVLRLRISGPVLLGAGLGIAVLTGMAAWLWELPFLTHGKIEGDLPLFGHVKATSALPFDTGVYLVVVGLVLTALTTLGRDPAPVRGPDSPLDEDSQSIPAPERSGELEGVTP